MRAILISLLMIGVCGCGSDDVETPEQPVSTPTASKPVDDPKPAAKTPDVPSPIENSIGMVLVPIPAGELMMGSPESEEHRDDGETQHRVTLTKSFHLGRTEVTQSQWKAVMGTTPWQGEEYVKEGDDYAATFVSWEDAVEFCRKLSEKEGVEYRLPTEAEWEYACRAGTTTVWSFGDDESQLGEYAWYSENAAYEAGEQYAHIVGQKKPNPWGLYDMHGNVFEWCQDAGGEYPSGDVTDPVGPDSGSFRVFRGGNWSSLARDCRSAFRSGVTPSYRHDGLGFRVLRSSAKSSKQPISDPKPVAKTPDVSPSVEQPLPVAKPVGDPIENSIGMVLVPIPAGEFMMGSRLSAAEMAKRFGLPADAATYFEREHPLHRVTLTKSFHLGRTEVTQGQWKAVMGTTPWQGEEYVKEGDDFPATHVSWDDAVEFCRKLSKKEGVEYRLPTEAEWEYACRAGTTTMWSFGDDESQLGEYAWYDKNADDIGEEYAHIVGQKKPNPWGLYDMHGNVFEWCQDAGGLYPSGDVTDPVGPASGSFRVYRGGSWSYNARVCRSADRRVLTPFLRISDLGFRVLRSSVK